MVGMGHGVVAGDGVGQRFFGLLESAVGVVGQSQVGLGGHQHARVLLAHGLLQQPVAELAHFLAVAGHVVVGDQHPQVLHLLVVGHGVGARAGQQLLRQRDAFHHLGMGPAVLVHQRLGHVAVDVQPRLALGHALELLQPVVDMARVGNGFIVERAQLGDAQLPHGQGHGLGVVAGVRPVLGHACGFRRNALRLVLHQGQGHVAVQQPALRYQHAFVGRVADQRVAEHVGARARAFVGNHQAGLAQGGQFLPDFALRAFQAGAQQVEVEVPAHGGGQLQQGLERADAVKAADQRVAQRERNGGRQSGMAKVPDAVFLHQVGIQQHARHFLDEQRHAVRAFHHVADHGRAEPARCQRLAGQFGGLGVFQAPHVHAVGLQALGRLPLRTCREHQQHAPPGQA